MVKSMLLIQIVNVISKEITDGNVIGWFEGRMEFGARALGNRSILANPRDPQMKSRLNRMIKKERGIQTICSNSKRRITSKLIF